MESCPPENSTNAEPSAIAQRLSPTTRGEARRARSAALPAHRLTQALRSWRRASHERVPSACKQRNAGETRPMTAIVDIIGREILDSRGNPTVEVDVVLEDGSRGRAGGAVGRLDRRARGHRAARRRQEALPRQGRAEGGRGRQRRDLRCALRHGRRGPAPHRRRDAQARRHAQQGPARRQCHPRRVAGRRQGGGCSQRTCRSTAISAAPARTCCPCR